MSAVRAIVVIGISALLLFVVGPPMFENPPSAYTGVTLVQAQLGGPSVVRVDRGSPAYVAGLRTGDDISCSSVRDTTIIGAAGHVPYSAAPLRLCVRRYGTWKTVSFVAKPTPPAGNMYRTPAFAALRLAVYVVFLAVGCALVLARPSLLTWLLFIYCAASAPILAAVVMDIALPPLLYATLSAVRSIENELAPGVLALFTLLVPETHVPPGWRWWGFTIVGLFTALAATATTILDLASGDFDQTGTWLNTSLTAITVLIVLVRLVTMERRERARFGWAAFAIIFGVVTNSLRTGGFFLSNSAFVGDASFVASFLIVVMPLVLMYAILRRHVIDVRFVLSRGVVYAAVTTIVVGLIGVVDWATSAYLHEVRTAMAIDAAVTIALGFLLHRTYGWIESAVDFLLFRHKHEAGAYLQRLAKTLPFAEHAEAVDRALVHDPYEKLDLAAAALFRPQGSHYVATLAQGWHAHRVPSFERDDDVVRFLLAERARLFVGDLRAYVAQAFRELGSAPALAVPVFARNRLIAFALYGIHRDGTQLDPDEVALLERLCDAAAQAYVSIELSRYEASGTMIIPAMEPL